METLITKGIKISVDSNYRPKYSNPLESKYVYSYSIVIENLSSNTVQLLRRHWYVMDGIGFIREVEGEGVIGKQPIINPGSSHQYESWSQLNTDMGKMYGTYLMFDYESDIYFKAVIPQFYLFYPFKVN